MSAEQVRKTIDEVTSDVDAAKERLLTFVAGRASDPRVSEVFEEVIATAGIAPGVVREAIWQLLDEGGLVLTEERTLRRP